MPMPSGSVWSRSKPCDGLSSGVADILVSGGLGFGFGARSPGKRSLSVRNSRFSGHVWSRLSLKWGIFSGRIAFGLTLF